MADYFTLFDLGLLLVCLLCVVLGATSPMKGLIILGGMGLVLLPFFMALPWFGKLLIVFIGVLAVYAGITQVSK